MTKSGRPAWKLGRPDSFSDGGRPMTARESRTHQLPSWSRAWAYPAPSPKIIFAVFPWPSQWQFLGRFTGLEIQEVPNFIGRGSWIRTNDLQYPKLPRYQAALYPD
jgi:hypothetical protein